MNYSVTVIIPVYNCEKYLERAFEKLKNDGCPDGEDLMAWFGKLVEAEIINDALREDKDVHH